MKIFMAASEVVPFAKTGGLADVAGALPLALEGLGHEVILAMPRYKCVDACGVKISRLKTGFSCATIGRKTKVYFVENEAYYGRDGLYLEKGRDYADNLERFAFFCRRSLDLIKEIGFHPQVAHVHDWQGALVPVYLKNTRGKDGFYDGIKTLLTIHNLGYQGLFPGEQFSKLGLPKELFSIQGLEFYGKVNLLKGGIISSDAINTVSPTYAREIVTAESGFGLDGVLRQRLGRLSGILNGLDYSIWDPATDAFIASNFSPDDLRGKLRDKEELQALCRLPVDERIPLLGVVSRLAEQKGFDILAEALEQLCDMDLQLVILGTGDPKYHKMLRSFSRKYPKKISLNLGFDDPLAHKIYAGADIFLMPSRYEPCGLGQLISLRYATVPVVFKTGGLADTVNKDNGFVFESYSSRELLKAVRETLCVFKDKKRWAALKDKGLKSDFSWKSSAQEYAELYAGL